MTRLILYSGKGGVGKTTVSAATAVAAARRGNRTLVLSVDLAHSLSDSFDLDRGLFEQNRGLPVPVMEGLDVQEIDVQEELDRHWTDIYRYMAMLMSTTGLKDVVAEEVAVLPGTEDVMALMYINQYISEGTYDTIVVDLPPTSDSLRFVNMTSTLEWYMLKRYGIDRMLVKVARPIANRLSEYALPDDGYFDAMKRIFTRVEGVDKLLVDPTKTTVRLVTQPEKMVIRETQRAYMYFCLYGVTTDQIIVNRMLPESDDPYIAHWVETQQAYADEVRKYFAPVPVSMLPLFPEEVVGLERLGKVADVLFGEEDPNTFHISSPPYDFAKNGDGYQFNFDLPFVEKEKVDVHRQGEDLIIRIGSFKRHVPLPRAVTRLDVADARLVGHRLTVSFTKEDV